MITYKDKLEKMVGILDKLSDLRLDTEGGYPDVIDEVSITGYVIVASIDQDAPDLSIYKIEDLLTIYDNFISSGGGDDEDLFDFFIEA